MGIQIRHSWQQELRETRSWDDVEAAARENDLVAKVLDSDPRILRAVKTGRIVDLLIAVRLMADGSMPTRVRISWSMGPNWPQYGTRKEIADPEGEFLTFGENRRRAQECATRLDWPVVLVHREDQPGYSTEGDPWWMITGREGQEWPLIPVDRKAQRTFAQEVRKHLLADGWPDGCVKALMEASGPGRAQSASDVAYHATFGFLIALAARQGGMSRPQRDMFDALFDSARTMVIAALERVANGNGLRPAFEDWQVLKGLMGSEPSFPSTRRAVERVAQGAIVAAKAKCLRQMIREEIDSSTWPDDPQ